MNTVNSANRLVISSSPHLRDRRTTASVMRDVVIALIPAIIASGILFGSKALVLIAVCVVSCVGFEYIWDLVMKKQNTVGDFSAVITGIIAFALEKTIGWRVTEAQEVGGIDLADQGERAYDFAGTASSVLKEVK